MMCMQAALDDTVGSVFAPVMLYREAGILKRSTTLTYNSIPAPSTYIEMKLRVPPTEKNFPGMKTPPKVYTTLSEQIEYIAITLSEALRIAYNALVNKVTRKGK